MNIQGFCSSFVDCESFPESNSRDILALCETNLNDSIDSGNFSLRGYLSLIWKDSGTHIHGLAVYVKEGLRFTRDLFVENSADSYLCFRLALRHSVSYFFFLYRSPSSALCTVFDSISSNIDEVLSINPSANVLSQMTLLSWLTFLFGSQTVILMTLLFWIYFLFLMLVFVLQSLSLHWEILIMLLSQFPSTFHQTHNRMPRFIPWLMTMVMLIGMVFRII